MFGKFVEGISLEHPDLWFEAERTAGTHFVNFAVQQRHQDLIIVEPRHVRGDRAHGQR